MKIIEINDEIKQVNINTLNLDSRYMYWITMSPEELQENNDLFSFNHTDIEECFNGRQNPRLEFYDDYDFIVLNVINFKDNKISVSELDVFLGRNYIITVVKSEMKLLDELEHELINYKQNIIFNSDRSVVKILYYLIDKIIINDYEIILSLENTAGNIEIKVMKNPDKRQLSELISIRRQVHIMRNYINPLRYIGDNLVSDDNKIIADEYTGNFQQIGNKLEKLAYSMESLIQYLILVREAYEAEIANKTNELMKVFTMIATIFLPLTLITGFFGMNFKYLNVFNNEIGFCMIVLLMITIPVFLYIYFKRKKWL